VADTKHGLPVPSRIGQDIDGRYRLVEQIGEGGIGIVYRAIYIKADKEVAIKVLPQRFTTDVEYCGRFTREARLASRIDHENCAQIYDFGKLDDGSLFIVMEFVDGKNAGELQHERLLTLRQVLSIGIQVCSALVHVHDKGIVHRDLKPDNIMVTSTRQREFLVKLLDFGIAKNVGVDITPGGPSFQTQIGITCGTPGFMSPEQIRGEQDIDFRADLYSLGAVLYKLTTGKDTFVAKTPMDVLAKALQKVVVEPRAYNSQIPVYLNQLIMDLLAKNPDNRPESALYVKEYLERVLDSLDTTKSRTKTPAVISAVGETVPARYEAVTSGEITSGVHDAPVESKKSDNEPSTSTKMLQAQFGTAHRNRVLVALVVCVLILGVGFLFMALPFTKTHHSPSPDEVLPEDVESESVVASIESDQSVSLEQPEPKPELEQQLKHKVVVVRRNQDLNSMRASRREQVDFVSKGAVIDRIDKYAIARRWERVAEKAKRGGKYRVAVDAFQKAYKTMRSPRYLKEIGFLYIKLGDRLSACRFFQRYVGRLRVRARAKAAQRFGIYNCDLKY